jgi:hypothetical protein
MPLDLKTLQIITIVALFVLLYAGRMVKGTPRETSDGLAFPLKTIVLFGRAVIIPLYLVFFIIPVWRETHRIPLWLPVLVIGVILLVLSQMPGTIVFTPSQLVQRFWLRKDKAISYHDIMTAQSMGAGRMTRILGNNRVSITHTWNHSGSAEFAKEIERRTGKRVIR